jgi:alpha-N-arabinofuranosidase
LAIAFSVIALSYLKRMEAAGVKVLIVLATLAALQAQAAPPEPGARARFDWFEYRGHDQAYATLRPGPDDYLNPILAGFYPDPSIVRVGRDFYLVNSTFCYFPGVPVFRSRDLIHWTQIGDAIERPSQLSFDHLGLSRGVFAPAISFHDGTFYILNTCVDCGGNYLITAKDPAGPWSDPVWLKDIDGIDPELFFDDDGKAYLLNNGLPEGGPLYEGHRAIWIQAFDLAARRPVGPRRMLVNGGVDRAKKPIWAEGPHLFRHDGRYYLITAEGGTAAQHSEVVYRASSVWGPFEPWSGNPILTQRDLDPARPFPVTSSGHAQLVQTPKGDWWSVFLATRPYRDDAYNTGRETFLLPVRWTGDGWPVILDRGASIPYAQRRPDLPREGAPVIPTHGDFAWRDDFQAPRLQPGWLMIRTPHARWYEPGPGGLALEARSDGVGGLGQPSFLGRRQQHAYATVTTAVRYVPARDGDRAGLVALQNEEHFYFLGLTREGGRTVVRLERRSGPGEAADGVAVASAPAELRPGRPVYLRIDARGARYDFAYALTRGRWVSLARDQDGELLSTKAAGGFVGTVIGVYAARRGP